MTMPELADALADATGVQAHPYAIGRFLRKLGEVVPHFRTGLQRF